MIKGTPKTSKMAAVFKMAAIRCVEPVLLPMLCCVAAACGAGFLISVVAIMTADAGGSPLQRHRRVIRGRTPSLLTIGVSSSLNLNNSNSVAQPSTTSPLLPSGVQSLKETLGDFSEST